VNTAVTVLETYGPAVTEALRQLDRATTVAWKAVNLVEVTDDEWQLVKRAIGIDRGWDAAYRLVSTLDLPGPPADLPPDGRPVSSRRWLGAETTQAGYGGVLGLVPTIILFVRGSGTGTAPPARVRSRRPGRSTRSRWMTVRRD
jgi:hypothetical protein